MTTKEIAQAVGKDDRTIQRWAKASSDRMPSIGDKLSASNSSNPADYDLTETCVIIEYGLGKNAADLYRMSAKNKPTQNADVVTRSDLAEFGRSIVAEMFKQIVPIITNHPKQIEFIQDYFTIKGYASKCKMQLAFSEALKLGREAGKLSREKNVEIRKADDEQYGQVNSYHVAILQEVFQL